MPFRSPQSPRSESNPALTRNPGRDRPSVISQGHRFSSLARHVDTLTRRFFASPAYPPLQAAIRIPFEPCSREQGGRPLPPRAGQEHRSICPNWRSALADLTGRQPGATRLTKSTDREFGARPESAHTYRGLRPSHQSVIEPSRHQT